MKNHISKQSVTGAGKPANAPGKVKKGTHAVAESTPAKSTSKQQLLANLLLRDEGATLTDMIAATGWLPHTTRAALTGLKKKGYALSSDKVDGVRTYRAVAPV
jgi:DNA-binding MarR family transcriptional regulator